VDSTVKIFLRQKGQFVGRRCAARSWYTPLRILRVLDHKMEDFLATRRQRRGSLSANSSANELNGLEDKVEQTSDSGQQSSDTAPESKMPTPKSVTEDIPSPPLSPSQRCSLCLAANHATEQHRCSTCTERGSHRSKDCPNAGQMCKLCGRTNHSTGQHQCSVCKLTGHRGRGKSRPGPPPQHTLMT